MQAGQDNVNGSDVYYIPGVGPYFLLVEADIRSAGMGDVSAALTDHPTGFLSNPARLADAQTFFFQGSTAKWFPMSWMDWRHYFASVGYSIENIGVFGLAFQRLQYDEITFTDASGYVVGEVTPYEMALTLGYGNKLTSKISFGANVKLIRRDFGLTATGYGLDFGILITNLVPNATYTNDNLSFEDHPSGFARTALDYGNFRSKGISIGICVQNIGPDIKFKGTKVGDPLPRNLKIGFAYCVMDTDPLGFTVAADFNRMIIGDFKKYFFKHAEYSLGAELNLYRLVDLRVGYFNDKGSWNKYITYGAGIGFDKFKFNVSRIPDTDEAGALAKTTFLGFAVNF